MRKLEAAVREQKTTRDVARAGNDPVLADDCTAKIKAYKKKYNEICEITGMTPQPKRMSIPKGLNSVKSVDFSDKSGIIEPDVIIGKSLGAAAHRDVVLLPNGNKGKIKEGTKITKVVKFAGQGTNKPVKISKKLSKIYKDYDVKESEWIKKRGDGYVVCDDGIPKTVKSSITYHNNQKEHPERNALFVGAEGEI